MLPSLLAGLSLAASASAACSRDFLTSATNAYVAAQSQGNFPSSFSTVVADGTNYTENERAMPIRSGVLAEALKMDHNRSIHDTTLCATFTEIIVTTGLHPCVIGTRMLFDGSKATLIESIVTDEGDWAFNATGYKYWNGMETWDPIPKEKQDKREVIKAAGDAYFDRFANINATVPWGTPCARLEGGAYTGRGNMTGNTCNLGLPSTLKVVKRRYVIDEEMGAVDLYLGFPQLDRSRGDEPMPDSHFFRVEGGKIRYIHTLSSCVNPGCGMQGRGPPQRRTIRRWL